MDEGGTVSELSRRELRKQRLAEYLAAKGKLKPPNPKPYLRGPSSAEVKNSSTTVAARGKENQGVNVVTLKKAGVKSQPLPDKAASGASGSITARINVLRATAHSAPIKRVLSASAPIKRVPSASTNPRTRPSASFKPQTLPSASTNPRTRPSTSTNPQTRPSASIKPQTHPSVNAKPQTHTTAAPTKPQTQTSAPIKSHTHISHPSRTLKVPATHSNGKAPPITDRTATSRPGSGRSAAGTRHLARPRPSTAATRMSIGTVIVRSKTGLMSAPVLPRDDRPQTSRAAALTATSATAASNRARQSAVQMAAVSQKAPAAQTRSLPVVAAGQGVQRRPARPAAGGDGAPERSRAPSQTTANPRVQKFPLRPVWQRPPVTAPAPTRGSTTGIRATALRLGERAKDVHTTKATTAGGRTLATARKAPQQTAEVRVAAAPRTCRASTGTNSQWQAKALSRAMIAAVSEWVQKDTAPSVEKDQSVSGMNDCDAAPSCESDVAAAAPAVPHTVPRAAVTGGRAGVVPQTEGKKKSATAQEERMRKLQEWRDARGISYKRPPMPVKPCARRTVALPLPYWADVQQEEAAEALIHTMDRSLDRCMQLLEEGCDVDHLQDILSQMPTVAQKFTKFWICRARLMERQGQLDVLPLFQEAVREVAEPVDELRTVVFDILRKKDETQGHLAEREAVGEEEEGGSPGREELARTPERQDANTTPEPAKEGMVATPGPMRALIKTDKGESSVVKFRITTTPGGIHTQEKEKKPRIVDGQEVRFFTPVRRSVRIDRLSLSYPAPLQERDLCVDSYNDLAVQKGVKEEEEEEEEENEEGSLAVHKTPKMYVYKENEALGDKVQVKLAYDDGETVNPMNVPIAFLL